jgi:hypothetical protein
MKYALYIEKIRFIFNNSKAQNVLLFIFFSAVIVIRAWGGIDFVRGDDARMLTSALLEPATSILSPYSGYLQVGPRTIIWMLSLLPLLYFPLFVFAITTTVWVLNILLFTRASGIFASSRKLGIILGLIITIMPPTGIEILAYLDHIQVPMLLGIVSTILSRKYFNNAANLLFLFYVVIFGLSSPSSIVLIFCFGVIYLFDNKTKNVYTSFEKKILSLSILCFIIQLLVTVFQKDRTAIFSLESIVNGIKFFIYSFSLQPIRDHFYTGFQDVDLIWIFFILSLLSYFIYSLLLNLFVYGKIKPKMGPILLGICVIAFYTSVSNNPHTGYLVVPTALLLLGVGMGIMESNNLARKKLAILSLLYVSMSSAQSFIPCKMSDVFFGGEGYIYGNLIPWSLAVADAKSFMARNPKIENIRVNTDINEPYWPVVIPRERLE